MAVVPLLLATQRGAHHFCTCDYHCSRSVKTPCTHPVERHSQKYRLQPLLVQLTADTVVQYNPVLRFTESGTTRPFEF